MLCLGTGCEKTVAIVERANELTSIPHATGWRKGQNLSLEKGETRFKIENKQYINCMTLIFS